MTSAMPLLPEILSHNHIFIPTDMLITGMCILCIGNRCHVNFRVNVKVSCHVNIKFINVHGD